LPTFRQYPFASKSGILNDGLPMSGAPDTVRRPIVLIANAIRVPVLDPHLDLAHELIATSDAASCVYRPGWLVA
jgi:hypothetical protein